jgi:hypothetical protein
MKTRARYGSGPRNLAVFALFSHVGGAVVVGLLGALAAPYFALVGSFTGAAAAGWLGVLLGAIVLAASRTTANDPAGADSSAGRSGPREPLPAVGPWLAIATGALASTVVASVTLVAHNQGGFLESPCQELSGGLGAHRGTIDTIIPAQYTCLYSGGVLPLVPPVVLALLSIVALAGAAAIAWGLWALRPRDADDGPETRIDTVLVVLATAVCVFLALDGVLGAVALLAPAGIGS